MPFIYKHVAVMPDFHWGMGATIGSVVPTINAVMPAAVGVDIGCGMLATPTNLKAEDVDGKLQTIFDEFRKRVPNGRTDNGGPNDRGSWGKVPAGIQLDWDHYLNPQYLMLLNTNPAIQHARAINQLGTLGTGNHFLELSRDLETDDIWLIVHSGSRGPGARICNLYLRIAKEMCKRWHVSLPSPDLAYLPKGDTNYTVYLKALNWAQSYATVSRNAMIVAARKTLADVLSKTVTISKGVHCHHNYAAFERHYGKTILVTRKGAVNAEKGKMGIIPGDMGNRTFIVRGKGNKESFNSCSHGAGRVMSRRQARETISITAHEEAVKDVVCNNTNATLDESPAAYKDLDLVMAAQADLVEPVHTLKAMICVKGADSK